MDSFANVAIRTDHEDVYKYIYTCILYTYAYACTNTYTLHGPRPGRPSCAHVEHVHLTI